MQIIKCSCARERGRLGGILDPWTKSMRIEPARLADLDRLVAIETAAFDPKRYTTMSRRQFRRHIDNPNAVLLVARDDSRRAVGYALGFVKANTRYLRFYSLAVDPAAQGGHFGAELFAALEKAGRRRGSSGVQCEIRADNAKLRDRYIALGYRPYREVADYYPDGLGCIKMKRDFAAPRQSRAGAAG